MHIRGRKMKGPTSVSKQIWIWTKSLLICTEDRCLYSAPWHCTNSNWIQIYRTKIKITCRFLYLSDSPERTYIYWELTPTVNTSWHIWAHGFLSCHTYEWVSHLCVWHDGHCVQHSTRVIGCLKLQVIFRIRATNYRALFAENVLWR